MQRALAVAALLGLCRVAGAQDAPVLTVSTGLILLKDDSVAPIDLTHRYVKFKSRTKLDPAAHQVVPPALGSAGDPTIGGATFTVYDTAGSGEAFSIDLPASGWHWNGSLYTFVDPNGPILRVYVRPYKLYVRGGGAGWGYTLDEPSQGRIGVRLRFGAGIEWCADAPALPPASTYDRQDKFWSAKTSAPGTCPPLPGG